MSDYNLTEEERDIKEYRRMAEKVKKIVFDSKTHSWLDLVMLAEGPAVKMWDVITQTRMGPALANQHLPVSNITVYEAYHRGMHFYIQPLDDRFSDAYQIVYPEEPMAQSEFYNPYIDTNPYDTFR